MKCSNCGGEISERAPFCGLCGTPADLGERPWDEDAHGAEDGAFGHAADVSFFATPRAEFGARRRPPPRGVRAQSLAIERADLSGDLMSAEDAVAEQSLPAEYRSSYEDAVSALIGSEVDDYLDRFQKKSVFNICAFLFGPVWYAYRRMIGKAFLIAFLSLFCGLPYLYFQCTGDKYYREYIEKHAHELAKMEEGSSEWTEYIELHGGTSIFSVFIYFFAMTGVSFFWALLIAAL